jgi:hypothetical protein
MEKGQVGLKQRTSVTDTSTTSTKPKPGFGTSYSLIFKDKRGTWTFAGPETRDWFLESLSKRTQLRTASIEQGKYEPQFQMFRDQGKMFMPIDLKEFSNPREDRLVVTILFETSLTEKELTPEMLAKLDVRGKFKSEHAGDGSPSAYWLIELGDVPAEIAQPFLKNLIAIKVATREIPASP